MLAVLATWKCIILTKKEQIPEKPNMKDKKGKPTRALFHRKIINITYKKKNVKARGKFILQTDKNTIVYKR